MTGPTVDDVRRFREANPLWSGDPGGCGPGGARELTGADLTRRALELTRARCAMRGLRPPRLVQTSAEAHLEVESTWLHPFPARTLPSRAPSIAGSTGGRGSSCLRRAVDRVGA